MKPEPPPYPRPVPSIDFDELPILPGTIVYTNEQELDENARAAKRRRIEANANAYLRGEGVFILSAGLRGPFDAGWKNPWATKTKKRKQEADVQIPPSKRIHHLPSNERQARGLTTPATSDSRHQPASKQENPFEKRIRSSEPPSHDEKVKSWLRRNSALPQESSAVPTSPTPKKRPSVAETSQSSKLLWTPTKQRITVNSQDVKAPFHRVDSRVANSFNTIKPPGARPQTHNKLQSALHAHDHSYQSHQRDNQNARHHVQQNSVFLEQPVRAEEAIIGLKRKSEEPVHKGDSDRLLKESPAQKIDLHIKSNKVVETAPEPSAVSAVLPDARPSVSENHIVPGTFLEEANMLNARDQQTDEPEVKLKELDASINEQLQENQRDVEDATPRVMEPSITTAINVPFLSTAVSEVQSTMLPPSAQHKPELQVSSSNLSSGALLPDILAESKKNTAVVEDRTSSDQRKGVDVVFSLSSHQQQTLDDVPVETLAKAFATDEDNGTLHRPSSHQNSPLPAHQEVAVQQQSIKSPIRELNGNVRMSQTSLDGSIVRSPASVQRNRTNKKAKKASFAAETSFNSSHGSIKGVLRVQKSESMEKVHKSTPPALSFSRPIDMDTSVEEGKTMRDAANEGSPNNKSPVEIWKVPRSILKSRSTHSSAAAALASAMLSPRNREESSLSRFSNQEVPPSRQNGVPPRQQDEDFDIEGALDDLGSFLSTWDAEKEGFHAM